MYAIDEWFERIKQELECLLSFTILTKKLFREIMNKLVKMQATHIFSD